MNEKQIRDIETEDYDIIENVVVALREIWKKKYFVLLITMAGFFISIIFINVKGNSVMYSSSATLFSAVYGSSSETNEGVAIMNRYSDLIGSSRVCSRAAQALSKYHVTTAQLQSMVSSGWIKMSGASTSSSSYGYKLTLNVYCSDEDMILPLTNAMASAFADELNDLIGSSAIQVMDEASGYSEYNTLNSKLYILLFTGGAFVAICGIIFCMAFFSPVVRSVAQCESDRDLVLGLLPYSRNKPN